MRIQTRSLTPFGMTGTTTARCHFERSEKSIPLRVSLTYSPVRGMTASVIGCSYWLHDWHMCGRESEYPVPEPNCIQNVLDSLTHPNARTVKPAAVMDSSIMEEIKKSGFIDKLYGRAG
jgi:hypothetical protein